MISDYLRELRTLVGHRPVLMPSACVAIRDGDRYLVGRHEDTGRWVFPGGAMDPGEHPADAAVREAWEETGLLVAITRLVGCYGGPEHHIEYPNGDVADYVVVVFEGDVAGGEVDPDAEELEEMRWVTLTELAGLDTAPWMGEVIAGLADPRHTHVPPRWTPPG